MAQGQSTPTPLAQSKEDPVLISLQPTPTTPSSSAASLQSLLERLNSKSSVKFAIESERAKPQSVTAQPTQQTPKPQLTQPPVQPVQAFQPAPQPQPTPAQQWPTQPQSQPQVTQASQTTQRSLPAQHPQQYTSSQIEAQSSSLLSNLGLGSTPAVDEPSSSSPTTLQSLLERLNSKNSAKPVIEPEVEFVPKRLATSAATKVAPTKPTTLEELLRESQETVEEATVSIFSLSAQPQPTQSIIHAQTNTTSVQTQVPPTQIQAPRAQVQTPEQTQAEPKVEQKLSEPPQPQPQEQTPAQPTSTATAEALQNQLQVEALLAAVRRLTQEVADLKAKKEKKAKKNEAEASVEVEKTDPEVEATEEKTEVKEVEEVATKEKTTEVAVLAAESESIETADQAM